ncbi:vomeronasal 2 receptor, 53 isoform X2 [Rattus norvegicus]|uniref:vomeronasal 2 receptor, 53 isoform X2 n=1 Tax=Rattus norvegicus TaxID=10116 RepID=UPI002FD81D6E
MRTLICLIATPSCLTESGYLLHQDGAVVIGAFFPVLKSVPVSEIIDWKTLSFDTHNSLWINAQMYQLVLAMIFAINEINVKSHILPNTSLGLEIYNLPHFERNILRSALSWLTGLSKFIPNYTCRKDSKSAAALTGISRKTSETFGTLLDIYKFPQLHPFLKNIQLINSVGDCVILDWKKKTDTEYDISNIWNFPTGLSLLVKVGTFAPSAPKGQQLSISEHKINWPIGFTEIPKSVCSESCSPGHRKVILESKPACCFDCTPCPDKEISNETDVGQCVKCPESHYANTEKSHCLKKTMTFLDYNDSLGTGLTLMSLGFFVVTGLVIGVFIIHRNTPIVKANNRSLSYILLITLTLCFLCPLLFIGLPNTATCILQQNLFGLLFTVALSTVLAKTITVVMAFKITAPGRKTRWLLILRAPQFIIPLCALMQILFSGIWLGTSPPFVDMDAHSEHGHIIILCNKGSAIGFYCTLAYLGVMAFGSYLLAFMSRNLPDTFNESKALAFSMLMFCSVWVTFLPVYHSTTGKVRVAMEMFSILASSASILTLIFVPKCYIVLFRPERNILPLNREKRQHRSKNPET